MSFTPYINYDEPRTAGLGHTRVKSIQAWKTPQSNSGQQVETTHFSQSLEEKLQNFAPAAGEATNNSITMQKITSAQTTAEEKFKFSDVIDVINPLHHIPLLGSLYRHFTEDKLHPISGIIGGAVYGGPVGAVSGTVNAVSQVQTGKDIGQHGLDFLGLNQSQTKKQPVPIYNDLAYNAYQSQNTVNNNSHTLQEKINQLRQEGVEFINLEG